MARHILPPRSPEAREIAPVHAPRSEPRIGQFISAVVAALTNPGELHGALPPIDPATRADLVADVDPPAIGGQHPPEFDGPGRAAREPIRHTLDPRGTPVAISRSYASLRDAAMAWSRVYHDRARETTELLQGDRQQIEARERDLQAVFDTIQDGLVLVDPRHRIRLINAPGGQILGASPKDLVGQEFPAERLPFPSEPVLAALHRLEAEDQQESEWETGGGGRAWQISLVPVYFAQEVHGSLIVIRDITRRHEVDRMKEELIGLTFHEIRSPLGVILGFSELLLSRELGHHDVIAYARYIYDEAEHLNRLVSNFLDIHRLEHGKIVLRREPLALLALSASVVEPFTITAPRHRLVLDIPANLPVVLADRTLIAELLTNLVSNAIAYSPSGGEVRVSARRVGTEVIVSVADAGLGIPAECLPRLFTKFYRVLTPERREIKGTGLGLAICRQIIQAHGGRIWAESAGPNQGSTFSFALPLLPPGETTAAPTTAS